MEELINIDGQQFYCSDIEQVVDKSSLIKDCAIIVDEQHLQEFLKKGERFIGKYINQIIIISDSVNVALGQLQNKNVLLISSLDLGHAIHCAILSEGLNKNIICIPKEGKREVEKILELMMVK